tara:strand:- start:29 stop:901 length:873 start_codon:yes stop_codon:yes gene_type:complete
MKVYPQNVILSVRDNIVYREEENTQEKICRICYEEDETESKLLNPCACSGTIGYIHEHCLKKWIKTKQLTISNYKCELCHKKLMLKKIFVEEKFKLFGNHKYCYGYVFDFLLSLFFTHILSFMIYSIDVDNNYMFVNQLDIHKEKSLLKVIKKEISSDEMAYFYFYYAFASFLLAMLYYFISLIYISFKINRKLTFFKINVINLLLCVIFSSSFFILYVVYVLFNGVSSVEIFVYTSFVFSLFFNWSIIKIYCFNYNENVKLMNTKYNKIEILNTTFNPLARLRHIQVDL